VAYVFCCPPPFPVLVTFWWSINHGCIHMTCNWRAKWWQAVPHLTTEVSTIHVVLFTCQLFVFNHSVLWHILQHMPHIKQTSIKNKDYWHASFSTKTMQYFTALITCNTCWKLVVLIWMAYPLNFLDQLPISYSAVQQNFETVLWKYELEIWLCVTAVSSLHAAYMKTEECKFWSRNLRGSDYFGWLPQVTPATLRFFVRFSQSIQENAGKTTTYTHHTPFQSIIHSTASWHYQIWKAQLNKSRTNQYILNTQESKLCFGCTVQ
jgi:hypothetical protein